MPKKKTKSNTEIQINNDSALRDLVGYNLKRAYMTLRDDFLVTLDKYDLRVTSFSALVLIVDRPDMTQSQLAEALSIERAGVVLIVDELENRELINRNKVEGDRRTYALRATLSGIRFCEKVMAATKAHEERVLQKLSKKQRAVLIEILNLIETSNSTED